MKVLLLNPPAAGRRMIREGRCTQDAAFWTTPWPPLSLATIGALLESRGYEVRAVDCAVEPVGAGGLAAIAREFRPSLVISSAATATIEEDLALAGSLKAWLGPQVRTAVFGTHPSVFAHECLVREEGLDCVIRDEPEYTCADLAHAVEFRIPLEGVAGLSFRRESGSIAHNAGRPFINNLDSLPFPAWRLVRTGLYRLPLSGRPFVMVAPMRGCPYRCAFCTSAAYYGGRVRRRSIESVIGEIAEVRRTVGVNDILFWADTFTVDRVYVRAFCRELLKGRAGISWVANSRTDTVDDETLRCMRQAGCWMISFGIESLSGKVLKECQKGSTPGDAERATRLAREAGLIVVGHFIFGLPGESEETLGETVRMMKRLDMDLVQIYAAVPFPGSALYAMAKANGWIEGVPWKDFRQDKAIMRLPGLPPEKVEEWIARGYREFYLHWRSLSRAWRLGKRADAGYVLKSAAQFVRRFL